LAQSPLFTTTPESAAMAFLALDMQQYLAAGPCFSQQLVVKHTFLEFVASEPPNEVPRACTDSMIYAASAPMQLSPYQPALEPIQVGRGAAADSDGSDVSPGSFARTPMSAGSFAPTPTPKATWRRDCFVPAPRRPADPQGEPRLLAPVPPGPVALGGAARVRAPLPAEGPADERRTTVMMRNIPLNYSRDMLLEMLDGEGFRGQYDFVYMPVDFRTKAGLGYAFVNLVDASLVRGFWAAFEGFSRWVLPTSKVCALGWSKPYQGLRANLQRYRNSSVMHGSVPDECKPVLFVDGERTAFPRPTRALQAPTRG